MTLLHVTNGDYAVEAIGHLGLGGDVLAWRDVLHEGPLEDRARFLAEEGWGDRARIAAELRARDETLLRAAPAEVVFWFESDLYDQLQLMQAVALVGPSAADAALAQFDLRPDGSFAGLSELSPAELRALHEGRRRLGDEAAGFLGRTWDAFCLPEPRVLEELALGPAPLPLVAQALRRHLEQFPAVGSGFRAPSGHCSKRRSWSHSMRRASFMLSTGRVGRDCWRWDPSAGRLRTPRS